MLALVLTAPARGEPAGESAPAQAPPARRPVVLDVSGRSASPPTLDDPVGPAPFSAYLNLRTGLDHLDDPVDETRDSGRQPIRLDLSGALAMPRTALDYSFSFTEDAAHPLQRGDIRVLQDFPARARRWTYGDLDYPTVGFQGFVPLGGVSVARNYDLQPYRVTEPVSSSAFVLRRPSTVEVLVNGARVRTFRLQPGRYNLRDLPVANGVNDVVLRIVNDVGEVEERRFSLFFDSELLAPGIDQYAASVGLPMDETDGRRQYEADLPTFSGHYRRGLTPTLTLGADLQGNGQRQLVGGEALWATRLGTVESRIAASHGESADVAARLGYRLHGAGFGADRALDVSLQYTGEDFGGLGADEPDNATKLESAVRYSQRLPLDLSGSIGGAFRVGHGDAPGSGAVSTSFSRELAPGANLSLNLERSRDLEGTYDSRAFLALNIAFLGTGHALSATRDTATGTSRLDWSYRPEQIVGGVAASAGVQRDGGRHRVVGEVSHVGYRGEVSLAHDVTMPRDDDGAGERFTSARFGTALVYAGGTFALSRPVSDAFAIVVPHPALEDGTVGVDPRGDETYEARADGFGPAVIPDLASYQVRRLKIEAPDLPPGAALERTAYDVVPTVRSGSRIEVGREPGTLVSFRIVDRAGKALPLQAGELRKTGDDAGEPRAVFSNRTGEMTADGLDPGPYELRLRAFPDLPVTIVVPEDARATYDAGTIRIGAAEAQNRPSPCARSAQGEDGRGLLHTSSIERTCGGADPLPASPSAPLRSAQGEETHPTETHVWNAVGATEVPSRKAARPLRIGRPAASSFVPRASGARETPLP